MQSEKSHPRLWGGEPNLTNSHQGRRGVEKLLISPHIVFGHSLIIEKLSTSSSAVKNSYLLNSNPPSFKSQAFWNDEKYVLGRTEITEYG